MLRKRGIPVIHVKQLFSMEQQDWAVSRTSKGGLPPFAGGENEL
jgi:hypothetical protein